jgi:hypothetical protein
MLSFQSKNDFIKLWITRNCPIAAPKLPIPRTIPVIVDKAFLLLLNSNSLPYTMLLLNNDTKSVQHTPDIKLADPPTKIPRSKNIKQNNP